LRAKRLGLDQPLQAVLGGAARRREGLADLPLVDAAAAGDEVAQGRHVGLAQDGKHPGTASFGSRKDRDAFSDAYQAKQLAAHEDRYVVVQCPRRQAKAPSQLR
jgi:L-amino acid N-acyltransferase YncA